MSEKEQVLTLELPAVFERPLSSWRLTFHGVLGLLCAAPCLFLVVAFFLWYTGSPSLPAIASLPQPIFLAFEAWATPLTLHPRAAALGSLLLLALSPIALQAALLTHARRHYAWCELDDEGASFRFAGHGGDTRLLWSEVEGWEAREHSVRLFKRGRRVDRFFLPLVIPTTSPDEQTRLCAFLNEKVAD